MGSLATRIRENFAYLRKYRCFGRASCGVLIALAAASTIAGQAGRRTEDHVTLLRRGESFSLGNAAISARWSVAKGMLSGLVIRDRMHEMDIRVDEPFRILLNDGTILDASNLKLAGDVRITHMTPAQDAPRFAATVSGETVNLAMGSGDGLVDVDWSIVLLEGSHYLRQVVTIAAAGEKDLPISRVQLIDLTLYFKS